MHSGPGQAEWIAVKLEPHAGMRGALLASAGGQHRAMTASRSAAAILCRSGETYFQYRPRRVACDEHGVVVEVLT